jgi:hypothetical protein
MHAFFFRIHVEVVLEAGDEVSSTRIDPESQRHLGVTEAMCEGIACATSKRYHCPQRTQELVAKLGTMELSIPYFTDGSQPFQKLSRSSQL